MVGGKDTNDRDLLGRRGIGQSKRIVLYHAVSSRAWIV